MDSESANCKDYLGLANPILYDTRRIPTALDTPSTLISVITMKTTSVKQAGAQPGGYVTSGYPCIFLRPDTTQVDSEQSRPFWFARLQVGTTLSRCIRIQTRHRQGTELFQMNLNGAEDIPRWDASRSIPRVFEPQLSR